MEKYKSDTYKHFVIVKEIKNMNVEEELINKIMMRVQKYVSDDDLPNVKDDVICCVYGYEISEKQKYEVIEYDDYNGKIMNLYLGSLAIEGKSPKTIQRYELVLRMFFDRLEKNIREITTNDLRYYLACYKEQRHVSGTTLDGMRRVFTAFFNWLETEEYIVRSPARRVSRIKKDTKKERELHEDELEKLANGCKNVRDRALIEFMYATAARVSEVAAININDVNFQEKSVLLHGKGGKDRTSFFTDKASYYLREYLKTRKDDNEALFVSLKNPKNRVTKNSIEQMVRTLGKKTELAKIHPHRFRVTRITILVNRGMALQDVQEIAGHADINTTQMYYRGNIEHVRAEYMKVS